MDISFDQIWLVVTSVVTVASVIVKFTPTPVDDGVVMVAHKVIDQLALTPKRK